MLLDWLSLCLKRDDQPDWPGWDSLQDWGDRIQRITPRTGEVKWETLAWDSVRSDSHQVVVSCARDCIRVQGSPARVLGDGDTVFGFGILGRNPLYCAHAMVDFVAEKLSFVGLPPAQYWHCTRIDVTQNYCLSSLADVRVALAELRNVEGGRYRVSQQAGDTVYWSHKSKLRAGKAYAKGPHLKYAMGRPGYTGREYSEKDLSLANRLLRLELRLGSEWLRRYPLKWYDLDGALLTQCHEDFFGRMVGDVEVADMGYVEAISRAEINPGVKITPVQAQRVCATWALIQSLGWQATRELLPRRTWFFHQKILRNAGFGDADLSAGRVVSLRRKLVMTPVASWEELRGAA